MIGIRKVHNQPKDFEILNELPVMITFLLLRDRFRHYKNPPKKIFDLVQKGYLKAIRKGQYLNLKSAEFKNVCVHSIANQLYSPSYLSLEWALQYYGILTDRVQVITSVTTKKKAAFETPLGFFSYEHLNKNRYPLGFEVGTSNGIEFFIARPEKALLDYINLRIGKMEWKTRGDITQFLVEDVRLKTDELLAQVSVENLKELRPAYHRNSKEARLLRWLIKEKEGPNGEST